MIRVRESSQTPRYAWAREFQMEDGTFQVPGMTLRSPEVEAQEGYFAPNQRGVVYGDWFPIQR
ncbi:MAG: hypothetical protein AAF191_04165 [Verrucomicrobiota bacterium]